MATESNNNQRVRVDADDAEFVQRITDSEIGAFFHYYDLLTFCASLAAFEDLPPVPVSKAAQSPSPIRLEVFEDHELDHVINLLAAFTTKSTDILSKSSDATEERIAIFEGLARAGIQSLRNQLDTAPSWLEGVELVIHKAIAKDAPKNENDLDDLLGTTLL